MCMRLKTIIIKIKDRIIVCTEEPRIVSNYGRAVTYLTELEVLIVLN